MDATSNVNLWAVVELMGHVRLVGGSGWNDYHEGDEPL